MKYFATFDSGGSRLTTYVEGVHENIPEGAIEISEEDQGLYCTGEYIRGSDGKPTKKPPYVPSNEEVKRQRLAELNSDYPKKLQDLLNAKGIAEALGNSTVTIVDRYKQVHAEYKAKLAEVTGA